MLFLMLQSFIKPHPMLILRVAIDSPSTGNGADGRRFFGFLYFQPKIAIYLAHCSCKAWFLQILAGLLFSFNFTLQLSLVIIDCINCCLFAPIVNILFQKLFSNVHKKNFLGSHSQVMSKQFFPLIIAFL